MMWILLAVLTVLLIIGLSVWKSYHSARLEQRLADAEKNGFDQQQIANMRAGSMFPVPNGVRSGLIALTIGFFSIGVFDHVFFYAEPGYVYHVRTITGQERVVDGVGYSMHLFGRINAWKKAMTVQADAAVRVNGLNAEQEGTSHAKPSTRGRHRSALQKTGAHRSHPRSPP